MDERERGPGGVAAGAAVPTRVGLALVASYAVLVALTYGSLPERVATHFSGAGVPNGWMSRDGFVLFMGVMVAVLCGVFFGLPRLLAKVPTKSINVPNRDYWTRPENLPALQAILGRYMGWMGVLVVGFMVGLFALTLRANLDPVPRLEPSSAGLMLALFLVADLAWLVLFLTRFMRVKDDGRSAGRGMRD